MLKHGVELGLRTWKAFLAQARLGDASRSTRSSATRSAPAHRDAILKALGIPTGEGLLAPSRTWATSAPSRCR